MRVSNKVKRQATRMDRYRTDYDDYVEGVDERDALHHDIDDGETQEYVSPLVDSTYEMGSQRRIQAVRLDSRQEVDQDGHSREQILSNPKQKVIHRRIDAFLNRGIALMSVVILFIWLIAFIF